jgi:hypothetical protein
MESFGPVGRLFDLNVLSIVAIARFSLPVADCLLTLPFRLRFYLFKQFFHFKHLVQGFVQEKP